MLETTDINAGPAKPLGHGFYLHVLTLNEGQQRPRWQAWRYQTGRAYEFSRDPEPFVDYVVPE